MSKTTGSIVEESGSSEYLRTGVGWKKGVVKPVLNGISFLAILLINAIALADPAPLNPKSSIDDVLDALQARGKDLKSFMATATLTDTDPDNGTETIRTGKLAYQIKPDGGTRVHLVFDQKQFDKSPPLKEKKEYLLENGWLTDRDYKPPNENRWQLSKPNDKVDLFRLGKGMCPLPIGQDKNDVHTEFDVTLLPAASDDPANTIHLSLKPKPKTGFVDKYSAIDVWADIKLNMPVRIQTTAVKTDFLETWDLQNMQVNPTMPDDEFQLPNWDTKWPSVDHPLAE